MTLPRYPVFDGHNDTLLSLHLSKGSGGRSFLIESDQGHVDLPRARRGGFAGGFFAIFVPPPPDSDPSASATPIDPSYALRFTNQVIADLVRLIAETNGQIRLVRSLDDLEQCLDLGVMDVALHLEGAEAIHPSVAALEGFYDRGLRSLGLVWSRPNAYGHGVNFEFPGSPDCGPGLTEAGVRLVHECNRLGILIDLSHITERGFWDVAEHTVAPLVVTHGSVHALCPSPRNLTDGQLDAIARTDGVVGINFHVGFLRSDGARDADTPLSDLVRHINYAVDRIGIDHVCFGSDFDGATMPRELGDVAGIPKLIGQLQIAGYDDDALHKLTHANWVRVLGKTWK